MAIRWTPAFTVGDATIDAQHARLLDQINTLLEALEKGLTDHTVNGVVNFLDSYISNHLFYEEGYMKAHRFPGFAKHKAQHDNFIRRYLEFKKRLAAGNSPTITIEVQDFLAAWWINHIQTSDREYHLYIRDHPKSHPEKEAKSFHQRVQHMLP